jgi:polyhydroxyalkanoate synthase
MTATNRSDNPGSAQERTEAAAGLAVHRRGRQASQPDPAASPTAQRGAEGAAWTQPVAMPSAAAVLSAVAGTVTPRRVMVREAGRLARELLRISLGSSSVAPAKGDGRFTDPTWTENPVYQRIGQAYLAFSGSMDRLVDEAEKTGKDPDKARFAVTLLTSAMAPTNFWLGNPGAIKRTLETGGLNLPRGLRNWVGDLRHNGGLPSMADPQALQVGRDLALTPGAVVERDEVAELIQYNPATGSVRERPVLVVPPPIGRFYFLDLRPGRSFIEYSVGRGLQTFVLSWRNPGKDQRDWDLDTYAARVLRAIDAIRDITGSADVNTIGFCAGGIITTGVLNHLTAARDTRIRSASFAVTMLDFGQRAPIQAFSSARLLARARARSRRAGVIAARDMGAAFTLMRPNDLIWNYWVNNYLMGLRRPVLERRQHEPARRAAPSVPGPVPDQHAVPARRDDGAGYAGRPVHDHGPRVRHRGDDRSSDAMERLLPHHPAAVRADDIRAQQQRAHPEPGQPPRQPEGLLLHRTAARPRR